MNYNKLIVVLLVVVAILAVVFVVTFSSTSTKIDSKINITNEQTLNEGGSISVKLTDYNGTPISNQTVNITIADSDKSNSYYSAVTNEKGVARLQLDKKAGNYTVICVYAGNENYAGCNASQKIIIEVEQVEEIPSSDTSYSAQSTYPSGLTDEEIDAYIQRDLDVRAQNGVTGPYDYEEARYFYETVPPSGMV